MWPLGYFGPAFDGEAYWDGAGLVWAIPSYWQAVAVIVSADSFSTLNAVEILV